MHAWVEGVRLSVCVSRVISWVRTEGGHVYDGDGGGVCRGSLRGARGEDSEWVSE